MPRHRKVLPNRPELLRIRRLKLRESRLELSTEWAFEVRKQNERHRRGSWPTNRVGARDRYVVPKRADQHVDAVASLGPQFGRVPPTRVARLTFRQELDNRRTHLID